MIRFILFSLLVLVLYSVLHFLLKDMPFSSKRMRKSPPEPEELVQDPYCQTYVLKRSSIKKRVEGKDYYFCSQECLTRFIENNKS